MRQALLALTVLLIVAACATSPTGRTQLMLVSEETAIQASSEAYLTTIGDLQKQGKISSDPVLKQRIEHITGQLVKQAIAMKPHTASWQWSVVIIDDPDVVNAWCMAGGKMAIYTGLIQKLKASDDEIAEVMGHEISHALANHTAEQMSVAMATQLGVLAIGAASKDHAAETMTGAAMAATLALQLPNSRTAESEADRIGIELAARAGFNPHAAISLWKKMKDLDQAKTPEFLSTHPDPANRQQALAALVPQMMPLYEAALRSPHHP